MSAPQYRETTEGRWLASVPKSYWQRGFNDGSAGRCETYPVKGGRLALANTGYINGFIQGRRARAALGLAKGEAS